MFQCTTAQVSRIVGHTLQIGQWIHWFIVRKTWCLDNDQDSFSDGGLKSQSTNLTRLQSVNFKPLWRHKRLLFCRRNLLVHSKCPKSHSKECDSTKTSSLIRKVALPLHVYVCTLKLDAQMDSNDSFWNHGNLMFIPDARLALSSANLNVISIDEGFWVEDLQHWPGKDLIPNP